MDFKNFEDQEEKPLFVGNKSLTKEELHALVREYQ